MWIMGSSASSQEGRPGVPPPKPCGPVPSKRQLRWHEMEFYAFIHFSVNTFTGREWGDGTEDPDIFNPRELDCRQWARVCREANMKGMILTAKHHDGFCLWPSKYTDHSVKSSKWRNGTGDVVREAAEACREYGLQFGIYLSPWDRHEPTYGDSPRYNGFYKNQLEELLTRYGEIFTVWWDGACGEGPNGKRQVYDWEGFTELVRKLQPNAVIFSDAGPDVRWVGNEAGFAGETNWCTFSREKASPGKQAPSQTSGHPDGSHWIPAECDTSIRPGWFYHPEQDSQVKSLEHLLNVYYCSVGRNANLNLNLPPDRGGRLHENDAARLKELRGVLDLAFNVNLAAGKEAFASNTRGRVPGFAPANALDGDPGTYWATDDRVLTASLEVDLGQAQPFNTVMLQEYIALGQRIEAFAVDAFEADQWRQIASGTTVGYKRIVRTETVTASRVRLRIQEAKACPTLSTFTLYAAPLKISIEPDTMGFTERLEVRLSTEPAGGEIYFTFDGSEPTRQSTKYTGPLFLHNTSTIRAIAYTGNTPGWNIACATFRKFEPHELKTPVRAAKPITQGLQCTYYEGGWQSLRDMLRAQPLVKEWAENFTLSVRRRNEHFALKFEGFLDVPRDGVYTFFTASDDGSMLYLGGEPVVLNDFLQGMTERKGQIPLMKGLHPIQVEYFNATGEMGLKVSWEGPGILKNAIPKEALFCSKDL